MSKEIAFYEYEALTACVQAGLAELDFDPETVCSVIENLDDEERNYLNAAVVAACREGLRGADIDIREQEQSVDVRPSEFDLHIFRGGTENRPKSIVFFRVRSALPDLSINLVALAVAALVQSPFAAISSLQIVRTVYENLAVLDERRDKDAIMTYKALLKHSVEKLAAVRKDRDKSTSFPRYTELQALGAPSPETTIKALMRLREIKVVEVVEWGDVAMNYSHPDNRWAITA